MAIMVISKVYVGLPTLILITVFYFLWVIFFVIAVVVFLLSSQI